LDTKQKVESITKEVLNRLGKVNEDPLQWAVVDRLLKQARRELHGDAGWRKDFRDLLGLGESYEKGKNVP